MPDKENGQNPPDEPANEASPSTKSIKPIPEQKQEVARSGQKNSSQDQAAIKELSREIHWVEKATFWTQVLLGVIGIAALIIYYRQLSEMKKATNAARDQIAIANDSLLRDKRSWVGIADQPVPVLTHFLIDPNSQNYEAQWAFLIQNFGPGIALNVVENFETANKHTLSKAFAETCEDAAKHYRKRNAPDIQGGYLIFPNQKIGVPGTELGNMAQLHSDGAQSFLIEE